MFKFLLIVQTLVAASLVTVILMQRSEGGGLGVGGSSSGLMTARGAADFLTRATAVLAFFFVTLAIALAALATVERSGSTIDASTVAAPRGAPAPIPGSAPNTLDPLAGVAAQAGKAAPATGVPLAPVTARPAPTQPAPTQPAQPEPKTQ